MKRILLVSAWVLLAASTLEAQTPFPMLMSLKPVAAQAGKTSEHTVLSRYSMYGAYQVLVTGEGVAGEIVTPIKKLKPGEKKPNLTSIKVKFTVAPGAKPGVRDFRIATPQGASTLGQLVIVRDAVIVEKGNNDTAPQAEEITIPSTVCGAIEKTEDVDYFKFKVQAGAALSFHVRSMRLQDKIHDLQKHSDPILSLRNASGTTLAQSDNHFAGDPFLSHRFQTAGEYLLEIRDVRYQGNRYWEYCIEISGRPFVSNVFPLGVAPGKQATLKLIGRHLRADATATLNIPPGAKSGPRQVRLLMGKEYSNPASVVVSDLPLIVETEAENNAPANAQAISVPSGVSGRIETEADIDCYVFEAKKGEKFSLEVIARRQWSSLDSIVRILDDKGRQLIENDDSKLYKKQFADSWIENWTAGADGKYTIEIRDVHLRGGESFVYFLKVTRSLPYFELYLDTDKTQLTPGSCGVLFVRAQRKNGFAGEIRLSIDGLPKGVTASCGRIPASSTRYPDGCIILRAAGNAAMSVANMTVRGTAVHKLGDDKTLKLSTVAVPMQETYMPGGGRNHWQVDMHTVSIGAPSDIRSVKLSVNEVTLKPGESKKIEIVIERADGFDKNVTLDMLYRHLGSVYGSTLPEGVTIDAKNSKTLITGKESKGYITLKADAKAAPIERRQVAVMANISINFVMKTTYSSPPLMVTVTNSATANVAAK